MSTYDVIQEAWRKHQSLMLQWREKADLRSKFERESRQPTPRVLGDKAQFERYQSELDAYTTTLDRLRTDADFVNDRAQREVHKIKYAVTRSMYGIPIVVDAHKLTITLNWEGNDLLLHVEQLADGATWTL